VFSIMSVFPCCVEAKVKRLEICFQVAYIARYDEDDRVGVSILGQPSGGDFKCSGDVK